MVITCELKKAGIASQLKYFARDEKSILKIANLGGPGCKEYAYTTTWIFEIYGHESHMENVAGEQGLSIIEGK